MKEKPKKKRKKKSKAMSDGSSVKMGVVGIGVILALLIASWVYVQLGKSIVVGHYGRFNMVLVRENGNVAFVTFDPGEKKIESIDYPGNLFIRSRSVGEYKVSQLYFLGKYDSEEGSFAKRKIQGFMRVPISGHLVSKGDEGTKSDLFKALRSCIYCRGGRSNLSVFDIVALMKRLFSYTWNDRDVDELVRRGVLVSEGEDYSFNKGRMQEYVERRFFDWSIAQENVSVSVINASGSNGMGYDVSDFLSNSGMDVVIVKGYKEVFEKSKLVVGDELLLDSSTVSSFRELLGVADIVVGDTSEHRADVVLFVGKDMMSIF